MRRIAVVVVLLGLLGLWSARFQRHATGAVVMSGGADGVGAAVSVNGHAVGRMAEEWRVSASQFDSILVDKHSGGAVTSLPSRRDSAVASRLDTRVPLQRSNEIVVVGAGGVRLSVWTPLGESTLVQVSFRDRRLTVTPAGALAVPAGADTSAEYDD